MADVWDNGPDDATLTTVLLVLANSADDNGGNCFPGNALIARRTRFSERTVIRAVVELERQGWIAVLQRRGGRPKRGARRHELAEYHTQYRINVAKLKGCQDVTVSPATSAPATEEAWPPKGCQAVTVPERKRVTPVQKSMTVTPEKGDSDDIPPHPLYGVSVTDPSGEPNPLPPPHAEGESYLNSEFSSGIRAKAGHGEESTVIRREADRVSEAIGSTAEGTKRAIRRQLAMRVKPLEEQALIAMADRMIAAHRVYASWGDLLRFVWGQRRFYGEGHWDKPELWPIDQERLAQQRRARL
jgi:hypothetical protein